MRPPRITFGRVHPNAGYQAKYRRAIKRLIKAMHEDTKREVRALYGGITHDAKLKKTVTIADVMAKLRRRWYRMFEKQAREMSRLMATSVMKRTRKDFAQQLKAIGLAIKPNYSNTEKMLINAIVQDGVEMIKTIPQSYLREVQEIVNDAVARGGDRATIKEAIEDKFDHPLVKTEEQAERRAELIAKDQVQKATQEFAMDNAKAYGATKAEWIHVPGEFTSRITHMEMDGKIFDLDVGMYDDDVGDFVMPGELPYCMCTFQAIFPMTE